MCAIHNRPTTCAPFLTQSCNQDFVNMSVGVWWTVSLLICLVLLLNVEPASTIPDHNEPVLDENAASPVGFIVPTLPFFQIDPNLAQKGILLFDIKVEFILGVIVALGIGPGIVYMAYTGADEQVLGLGEE
jgi:hypothetical protein